MAGEEVTAETIFRNPLSGVSAGQFQGVANTIGAFILAAIVGAVIFLIMYRASFKMVALIRYKTNGQIRTVTKPLKRKDVNSLIFEHRIYGVFPWADKKIPSQNLPEYSTFNKKDCLEMYTEDMISFVPCKYDPQTGNLEVIPQRNMQWQELMFRKNIELHKAKQSTMMMLLQLTPMLISIILIGALIYQGSQQGKILDRTASLVEVSNKQQLKIAELQKLIVERVTGSPLPEPDENAPPG